jgi:ribonuclease R
MWSADETLRRIRAKVDHPATAAELIRLLRVPRIEKATFRRHLATLVANGALVQTRGRHYGLPEKMDLVVGSISVHPDGFGFVRPDRDTERASGDIFVAGANMNEAMHGDTVVVRVERLKADGRAEGRILRILQRASETVVGRFDVDPSGLRYVVPFDRRLLMDVQVPRGEEGRAVPGDMVTVRITRWPTPTRVPLGRVVEVLGAIDAPGVDTRIVIRKWNLPDAHGDEAVEEARRLGGEVHERDLAGRTDFRDRVVVTIDGEHARDFDDAISIERLPTGHYWLGVHVADVSHYVEEGSALDAEAYERGTSVYFPERAVHMFPPELATGLCSLRPHVDRLVQSCLMEVDLQGQVRRYELHDGVIRSAARMTYTDVNAILADRDAATVAQYEALVPTFELMRALFEILNARRRQRGSVDFDLPEAEVRLDADGLVEDIIAGERNVAHRIIEEFMLLANEVVAQHLDDHDVPTLYRVHERPDPMKVSEFDEFVSCLGYGLAAPPEAVRPRHFQRLVERIRGTPEERPIAFLMLRTMQKARYDPANLGHFGLATQSYAHFTSPIRRYPDLVVHRTLREWRHGRLNEPLRQARTEDLPDVARHTSERERRAADAERELLQWKKVRFMADKVGDEFEGYVTGVAPFGLFVELTEHYVEGLVHVSTLADDYYRFLERSHALFGETTRKTYRLGDRVRVQVARVDMERRQVDLGLVDVLEAVRRAERTRGAAQSPSRPKKEASRPSSRAARSQRPGRRERLARAARKSR